MKGRGGDDGTPVRKTPWAEIAWQIGLSAGRQAAEAALDEVAEHEKTKEAPGGDAIRRFLPKNKPCLSRDAKELLSHATLAALARKPATLWLCALRARSVISCAAIMRFAGRHVPRCWTHWAHN